MRACNAMNLPASFLQTGPWPTQDVQKIYLTFFQENETIVTDEEVALAGHVSSMLSRVIYEYETQRYQPGPYIPPNMAVSGFTHKE